MGTQVDKSVESGLMHEAEEFGRMTDQDYENSNLIPGGEMVSQRTLNPLFLVRVQAWEMKSYGDIHES